MPDDLAAQLDADFAEWYRRLPLTVVGAIWRWQQGPPERWYQQIQHGFREGTDDGAVLADMEALDEAISAGVLRRDVVAWRGVRSADAALRRPAAEIEALVGSEIPFDGLFAVSLDRDVPVAEFAIPPLAGGPALFEVMIPAGIHAAWVALAGAPSMRYQHELLLGSPTVLRITSVAYTGDVPLISVEVVSE